MREQGRPGWQKVSRVFDERAQEYDSWFDDSLLFAIELAALQELATPFGEPRVEVGAVRADQ